MQLAHQPDGSGYAVKRIADDLIGFDSGDFRSSMRVGSMCAPALWTPRRIEEVLPETIVDLLKFQPSLILLGTGRRQQFPAPRVLAPALLAGVGIEVMDNRAAARTYNVLLAEGRNLLLAVLLDPVDP